jgi:hypothetical protein
MPIDLINYKLEAQWLLTWYPRVQDAHLKEVKIRGGSATYSTGDFGPGLGGGTTTTYMIGQGAKDDGEPLGAENQVRAYLTIGITQDKDQFFDIGFEVIIGQARQTRHLVLLPDTGTPFMINVHASGNDAAIQGTAAVFQGVFVTGHRLLVSEVLTSIFRRSP